MVQLRQDDPEAGAGAMPALSRRHAAGAPSARGLLFTLLGEFVLTGDGTAWTSAVLAVFTRLGIEEKATRQALMRTAAAGWLDAEKLGRRTRWRRLDVTSRSILTLIEPGSCFAGSLLELALAADRSFQLSGVFEEVDPDADPATITVGPMNTGPLPMGNGLTRPQTRYLGDEAGLAEVESGPVNH